MTISYRKYFISVAGVLLAVAALVVVVVAWLGRDEVVTQGSAYGFTIGMSKAEVLEVIHGKASDPFMFVEPEDTEVQADLQPGSGLARSNSWRWALAGVPIDCHDFYFEDGRLKKMVTKKRLYETM